MVIDAHVHLVDFEEEYIKSLEGEFKYVLAVSCDFEESLRTVEISRKFEFVYPGIGLHPWNIKKNKVEEILEIRKNIRKMFFFGEIGLDKRFYPETFEEQRKVFERFLEVSSEEGIPLNLHSAGAWKEVLDLLRRFKIEKVIFHWYTGPYEILEEIIDLDFFVSFNPAIFVQEKQRKILERTPLENLLVESDGPYSYKNVFMEPKGIPKLLREISRIKGCDLKEIKRVLLGNVKRFLE